ncbi:uncharacterized protein KNAG_0F02940 [Huiozyma naganishii CBS 8797]|uniref:Uncharacterized protein n=1 Tax=Huiozyma naganishii (strain ATCC MYA-139 / BCRC 22969 / CBS 8797 / KCTC 17520 / NBRC 10181 / NCYC 3082 / Yp74L-3) TaxID=1071383 RepID=J7S8J9_HUIN7|nr:hypothetical protein KNAG_0F02940 [Kazachstania naganishii CBS 8797]CCK70956.1 hypothetical protein KNAG_0F02940 [Kazachstania naganishii CBS 8797]
MLCDSDVATSLAGQRDACNWRVCRVLNEQESPLGSEHRSLWFLCTIWGPHEQSILFLLLQSALPFQDTGLVNPIISELRLESIEEQYRTQGFEAVDNETIIQEIHHLEELCINDIALSISINPANGDSSLRLTLTVPKVVSSLANSVVAKLYSSLIEQFIEGGQNLLTLVHEQEETIHRKDDVVQFLKDTTVDLGGSSTIDRWAPPGSINYHVLKPRGARRVNKLDLNRESSARRILCSKILDNTRLWANPIGEEAREPPLKRTTSFDEELASKEEREIDVVEFDKEPSSSINTGSSTEGSTPSPSKRLRKFGKIKAKTDGEAS